MLRRLVSLSLATGLLSLSGVVGAPAHADEETTSPAGGMVLPGDDLEQESSDLGAPVEVTAGTWRGELGEGDGADGSRYFVYERTIEDSTVIVSALSPGAEQSAPDGISLSATNPAGEDCVVSPNNAYKYDTDFVTLSASLAIGVQEAVADDDFLCLTDDRLVIALTRDTDTAGTAPYALRIVEESPLASDEGLPGPLEELPEPEAPSVEGDPEEVAGAPGLGDAPEVRDGIYQQAGRSDRTTYYRVPDVRWGQSVRAAAVVQPSSDLDEFETGPEVTVSVLSPMGDYIGGSYTNVSRTEPERAVIDSGPVRYRNRFNDSETLPWAAGDHYLRVTVEPTGEQDEMDVDFTLQVQVAGEEDDAPDFTESDAYLVADGDQQPVITAWGVSALDRVLGGLGTVVRYGGAAILGVLGLVTLVLGVRTLRTTPSPRAA
ncbi:hypothetical protein [Nocardioides sp. CFH 31398]|uniref:hypothetical protein n=1 Tax=Nocardioides sp. CFH 31398 TaxID=2919579 RepID=UPI001F06FF70|nr:hypothetical protein [Nocardioides sp. CFH 31398]MCH1868832.1 hypothetical protein [Nocardioides sp. CFH 31398]